MGFQPVEGGCLVNRWEAHVRVEYRGLREHRGGANPGSRTGAGGRRL